MLKENGVGKYGRMFFRLILKIQLLLNHTFLDRFSKDAFTAFGASARRFGFLTGEKVLRLFLSLFVGAWVLRYLGPSASGSITFILANVAILTTISRLGFDSIVVREVILEPENIGCVLGTTLFLRAVAGIGVFSVWVGWAAFSGRSWQEIQLSLILSTALVAQPFEIFELWFVGSGQVEKPVIARSISMLVISGFRVWAILSGLGILIFSAIQVAEAWTAGVLNYLFFSRRRRFSLSIDTKLAFSLLSESWTYLVTAVGVIIYMRLDQIMLGSMSNGRSVGIFYAAVSLCEALYFLPTAINVSVIPVLTKLKLENEEKYESAVAFYCNAILLGSFVISCLVWILAPVIVLFLFGHQYDESVQVLRVYIWCFCMVGYGVAQTNWFVNHRRGGVLLKKTIIGLFVNASLNILFIPRYGPVGAAWGTIGGQFAATIGTNLIFDRSFISAQIRSAFAFLRPGR